MTRKILSSISINFSIQTGINSSGSPIVKRQCINNIYPNAQESDLFAIYDLIKGILRGNVTNSELIQRYRLTDN